MYPSQHTLLTLIFLAFFYILFPETTLIQTSIIFISAIFIDVDHYLAYAFKKKDWNLRNAYRWYVDVGEKLLSFPREQRNKFYMVMVPLHGIETILILAILGFLVSKYFLFILIGFSFHIFLDLIYQQVYWDRVDKFSVIFDYFKFKKLEKLEA